MRPRPPSSTLFPYTTLFRSRIGARAEHDVARPAHLDAARRAPKRELGARQTEPLVSHDDVAAQHELAKPPVTLDFGRGERELRLAVFCAGGVGMGPREAAQSCRESPPALRLSVRSSETRTSHT